MLDIYYIVVDRTALEGFLMLGMEYLIPSQSKKFIKRDPTRNGCKLFAEATC